MAKKQKLEVPGAETLVEDQSMALPTVVGKQKLESPETKTPVVDQSTEVSELAQNEDALNSVNTVEHTENEDALNSVCTRQQICLAEHAFDQSKVLNFPSQL